MKGQVKIKEKERYIAHSLTGILDIIICLLLFISSIYKGAFYKSDFLFPNAIISCVGAIYLVYKIIKEIKSKKDIKVKSKLKVMLDIFMLAMPFCYGLPIVFKTYVSLPDSIYEMLRYVDMSVIYFIARSSKNEKMYLNIFVIISIVQMILGIDQLTARNFEKFLNNISTGYLNDTDRLSATIQYANVTGIVISMGIMVCFNKIAETIKSKSKSKYVNLAIISFITLLGVFTVCLTKSRVVALATLGLMLIDTCICYMLVDKKSGIYMLCLEIYAVAISGILEKDILQKSYNLIYIKLAIFTVLFIVVFKTISSILNSICEKNNGKIASIKEKLNKWYIKIVGILAIVVFCLVAMFVTKNLKVSALDGKTAKVARSIYDFEKGTNTLEFKVDSLEEDTRYSIEIREVGLAYGDYNVATYNYYDNTSGNFNDEITIHEDIRKLIVNITVQKGKIEIIEFKLNGKNIPLSYMFMPDSVVFKVKDTFAGVYGDTLRLAYLKDTFKLLKQSPVIGVGGEGFKHTYGTVQETGYISSEAHSAILQALVEVGIVGTIALVGSILVSLVIIFKIAIRFKKLDGNELHRAVVLFAIYLALLSSVVFDLAFSYAFMIYVFAIISALLIQLYIDVIKKYESGEMKKGKIDWSYIRLMALSLSLVVFAFTTYFSFSAYKASLVKVPNKKENDDISITEVAENIAYLELKNKEDKFDIDYMMDLNDEYETYKTMLTKAYVNAANDKRLKEEINTEITNTLVGIKENTDKMLEYEYYNKYVLNEVADVYMYNFVKFADIYKDQFSSEEVAYTFYLNYVIKLTDRIIEINPKSEKANTMYKDMCKEYIEELEKDNKYLSSKAIQMALQEFKARAS